MKALVCSILRVKFELEKLSSIENRGQTDLVPRYRVTTPKHALLRRCRWPRPLHAGRLAALARS